MKPVFERKEQHRTMALKWLSKSTRYALKVSGLIAVIAGIASLTALAQGSNTICTNFTNSTLQGWTATNVGTSFATPGPGGASDVYLRVTDRPNTSTVNAAPAYRGNWTVAANCNRMFCYDVQIFNDGLATSANYSIGFILYGGNGYSARFTPSILLSEPSGANPGWHTICAPIGPLVGSLLPPGWSMITGTNANWTALLSNVTNLTIGYDVGTTQTEVYGLDNLCIRDTCIPPPPPCYAPPMDMTGWWTFDQAAYTPSTFVSDFTGTANYVFMNAANNGTVINTGATSITGKVAGAINLNGQSWISVPDDPSLDFGTANFSIDVWVYPTDNTGIRSIADKRTRVGNAYTGYALYTNGGNVSFQLGSGPLWVNYPSNISIPLNAWSFISVRVDRVNARIRFDINGAPPTIYTITASLGSVTNTGPLLIGGHQFPNPYRHWQGRIDELEIFGRRLEDSEIQGIYGAGISGKCKDLSVCALNSISVDSSCCTALFSIPANTVGVLSIDYTLSGGSVLHSTNPASITTSPCNLSTSSVYNPTNGVLTFSSACTSLLNIQIQAYSPTGTTTVTFIVRYANGTRCTFTREFSCDRPPVIQCDGVSWAVAPPRLVHERARRFTISNSRIPASPISHVRIITTPPLGNALRGRDVAINSGSTIIGRFIAPFNRLPNNPGGSTFCNNFPLASNDLQLTLATNIGWNGTVQFVVYHCNGDSCLLDPILWRTTQGFGLNDDPIAAVVEQDTIPDQKLFISRLHIRRTKTMGDDEGAAAVKSMEVFLDDDKLTMVALGAGWNDADPFELGTDQIEEPRNVNRTTIAAKSGVIEFNRAVVLDDSTMEKVIRPIRVIYSSSSAIPLPNDYRVQFHYTLYDEDHNPLKTGSMDVPMSVKNDRDDRDKTGGAIVGVYPNPSTDDATVSYILDKRQEVTLEVCDVLGSTMVVLERGWKESGLHDVVLATQNLPSGIYLVKLQTATGANAFQLQVIH